MSNEEVQQRIKLLDKELKTLHYELENCTGQTEVEVYSRIVGYFRQTKGWNKGKKSEWKDRVSYII